MAHYVQNVNLGTSWTLRQISVFNVYFLASNVEWVEQNAKNVLLLYCTLSTQEHKPVTCVCMLCQTVWHAIKQAHNVINALRLSITSIHQQNNVLHVHLLASIVSAAQNVFLVLMTLMLTHRPQKNVPCSTLMPRCSTCLQSNVCTACATTGGPFYLTYPPSTYIFISKTPVWHVKKQDLSVWPVHRLLELVQHAPIAKTSFTWKTTVASHVLPVVLCVPVWLRVPVASTRLLRFTTKCVLLAVNSFPTVSNAAAPQYAQSVPTTPL